MKRNTLLTALALVSDDGRYLTGALRGGLSLTEKSDGSLSLWTLQPSNGGWNVICAGDGGASAPVGLEFRNDRVSAYSISPYGACVFNFYEVSP